MNKHEKEIMDELHRIRESNYKATKDMTPREWAKDLAERTAPLVKKLGLKVISPNKHKVARSP